MNAVYPELNGIIRKALGWAIAFAIAGVVGWGGWITTTLIDIRVNVATIQERVQGIERLTKERVPWEH